jgi:hypothetical protein
MFKISPIQSVEEQIKCAKECNTEYKEGAFAYTMNDSETGAIMGFSQFEITSDGGYLHDLRPAVGYDDYEAMFILGRATMNFIDLCGAHTLSASIESGDNSLLRAIGLRPTDNGSLFCDMTGFFDGSHCSGH